MADEKQKTILSEEDRAKFATFLEEQKAKTQEASKKSADDFVVVELQIPGRSQDTGKYVHKAYNQSFGQKEWQLFIKNPNGMLVTKYINLPKGCEKLEDYQKRIIAAEEKKQAEADKNLSRQQR